MTSKAKKYWRITVIGLFGGYLIFQFCTLYLSIKKSPLNFTSGYKTEYVNLFPETTKQKLTITGSHLSDYRNPISNFNFGKSYEIVVYKIDLTKKDESLDRILNCNYGSASQTTGEVYSVDNQTLYDLMFKSTKPEQAENINMTVEGDSLLTIFKNDTLAYFYFQFKKFSIHYQKDLSKDLVAESRLPLKQLPASVLFLKKENFVYLFILSTMNEREIFDKQLLYKLVSGEMDNAEKNG